MPEREVDGESASHAAAFVAGLLRSLRSPLPWLGGAATAAALLIGHATPAEAADVPAPASAELLGGVVVALSDGLSGAGQTLPTAVPATERLAATGIADGRVTQTVTAPARSAVEAADERVTRTVTAPVEPVLDAGAATGTPPPARLIRPVRRHHVLRDSGDHADLALATPDGGLVDDLTTAIAGVMPQPVDTAVGALVADLPAQPVSTVVASTADAVNQSPGSTPTSGEAAPAWTGTGTTGRGGAQPASPPGRDPVPSSGSAATAPAFAPGEPPPSPPSPLLPIHLPSLPWNAPGSGGLSSLSAFGSASLAWTAMLAILVALLVSARARLGSSAATLTSASLVSRVKRPG